VGIEFDLIRDKLKRYKLSSITRNCFTLLNEMQLAKNKNFAYWNLLVLFKWANTHTDENQFKQEATRADIVDLMSLMEKFEYDNSPINFKTPEGFHRGFRVIAAQQFPFQDYINLHVFERQLVLYSDALANDKINEEFRQLTGFELLEFIDFCFIVFFYFNRDRFGINYHYDGTIEQDFFDVYSKWYPHDRLLRFIDLLMLHGPQEVINLQKTKLESHQMYETGFLTTKPFFPLDRRARIFHRNVFGQTCKHYIYDFMKSRSDTFSSFLGARMERYLKLGLDELKLSYRTEKDLKREFTVTNVADYMVGDNLLIESKAVELSPRTAVSRQRDGLKWALGDSVVKGYCQLLATAKAVDPQRSWYGLLVTYKEMYLGFGPDAWDKFLKDKVERFARDNNIDLNILPPKNLFIIDLDTWDQLVSAIKNGTSFEAVFEKAKGLMEGPDRVFTVEQVLKNHFTVSYDLDYLAAVRGRLAMFAADNQPAKA